MNLSKDAATACAVGEIVACEAADVITPAAAAYPVIQTTVPESLPALVHSAGPAAQFAWEEFIYAQIRNPHTRAALRTHAVQKFLSHCHQLTRERSLQYHGMSRFTWTGFRVLHPQRNCILRLFGISLTPL